MRKRRVRRAVVFALLASASAAAVVACLDLTPITSDEIPPAPKPPRPDVYRPPPPMVDAGSRDVVTEAEAGPPPVVDVDLRSPCEKCTEMLDMPGPGCATELATCLANAICNETWQCVLSSGCLLLVSRQDLVACSLPCVQEAGITSQASPEGMAAFGLAKCIVGACGAFCGPAE